MPKKFTQVALRTAIFYAVIAGVWILLSDRHLAAMAPDTARLVRWAMIKGWLFVGVTSLLLYFELRRQCLRLEKETETRLSSEAEKTRSEAKFRSYVERAPMGVFVLDPQGRCVDCNPAMSEMLGFEREKLLTMAITDVVLEEDPAETLRDFERLKSTGFIEGEYRLGRSDGTPAWMSMHAVKIGTDRFLGFCLDITERKREEAEREEALGRLDKIASRVPGLVYQFRSRADGTSCLPYASDGIREIFRLSPEEVREDASKVFASLHPEDRPGIEASIQKSAQDLSPWQQEFRAQFADGTIRWLFGDALPQRETDGSTLWHGFITDITWRKRAEQGMRESEEQFRAMFELASIGMAQTDPRTGQWLRVNQKFCAITGYSASELLGMRVSELTHPDDRQPDWELFQSVVRGEAPDYRMEKRYICKDGTIAWVNVNMTVIRDAAGQPVRTMAAIEDITERKRIEAEVLDHVEQLRARNEELQRFMRASTGRELRMIELKRQVNDLCRRLGRSAPYSLDFVSGEEPPSKTPQ
jgi:PAS domain S-box-containing protein